MPQSDDPVQQGSSDRSLDGIKSERWTASSRKGGRDQIGTGDDFKSVHMDGLRRYPHEVKNEHGQRVLTVTITMEIYRVDLEPLPPRR